MHALADLEVADVDFEGVGNRPGFAGNAQGVCDRLEDTAGGNAGRVTAELEWDFGLDDFLGADAREVEVEDFLAEVVPLGVADQDRFDGAPDIEIGEVSRRFNQALGVAVRERDRHDGLFVSINDRGHETCLAQPARDARACALVFGRVAVSTRILTTSAMVCSLQKSKMRPVAGRMVQYYQVSARFFQYTMWAEALRGSDRASPSHYDPHPSRFDVWPSCRTASNTATATAFARFRHRASGRIGIRKARSGARLTSVAAGRASRARRPDRPLDGKPHRCRHSWPCS